MAQRSDSPTSHLRAILIQPDIFYYFLQQALQKRHYKFILQSYNYQYSLSIKSLIIVNPKNFVTLPFHKYVFILVICRIVSLMTNCPYLLKVSGHCKKNIRYETRASS